MFDYDENLIKITEFKMSGDLPDIFTFKNGKKLTDKSDWPLRRTEILKDAVDLQYGVLLPEPEVLEVYPINRTPRMQFFKIITGTKEKTVDIIMMAVLPEGKGPFPAVISGDITFDIVYDKDYLNTFTDNGIMPVFFNRLDLVADRLEKSVSPLYDIYPNLNFGAIAAWAWGYSRTVDALEKLGIADMDCIAFTGHSRGGKTALLAGALDTRAAIVNTNESGAGGGGCYRVNIKAINEDGIEQRNETLKDLYTNFHYWFNKELFDYIDREEELPFDEHMLKSLVAPRILLSSDAASDIWANPVGTYITNLEAKKLYEFLNVPENLIWYFRKGSHRQKPEDIGMLVNVIRHYKFGENLNNNFFKLPFKFENSINK